MKISVNLNKNIDHSYDIIIKSGSFDQLAVTIDDGNFGNKYVIISDRNVAEIYGEKLVRALANLNIAVELLTFNPGDEHKNLVTAEKLLEEMFKLRLNRKDAVIALGGGVTGDVGGFVASVFMRGIALIQVPTSLLAMIDAGIGGKTGINNRFGKNLIGTFHQPKAVFIDPGLLSTLPHEEYINGISEIVKYGAIADEKLFTLLENNIGPIMERDRGLMEKIITSCCEIKAEVVGEDEKESGRRMILNYGHTIGHAIEQISGFKIPHGQAIAMGMKLVNYMGVNHGLTDENSAIRINNLINSLNLCGPEEAKFIRKISAGKIWDALQSDKKADTAVNFIVISETGKCVVTNELGKADIARALKQYL